MPSTVALSLQSLPNELLDEIILLLSTPPPSSYRLHRPPSLNITKSGNRDLKNLSLTCSRLLDLVRPRLVSHTYLELRDLDKYLAFVSSDLYRYVISVVVNGDAVSDDYEGFGPLWWQRLLQSVRPLRFTIIAPPSFIKGMLGMQIPEEHGWAFEIQLQLLQLECEGRAPTSAPAPALQVKEQPNLLDFLPWSCMLFNESSSLKAYNHYEYFLYQVPSLFHRWSSSASAQSSLKQPHLSLTLENLTSFTYVAVFPFYNHVQLVLDAVELMTNLRSLSMQLGPSRDDRVTELEQRGSMDPSDPWMELATGYSLIAHAVRDLGRTSCLSVFTACDYEVEAVRTELDVILGDILHDSPWTHNGYGTWTKNTTQNTNMERARVTAMPFTTTYNIEPAGPVLACSLLQSSASFKSDIGDDLASRAVDPEPTPSWNLELDIARGLHSRSNNNIFQSGTVIGFSRLRRRSLNDDGDDEFVGELPRYLLTNWLRRPPPTDTTPAPPNRAFIIHPANLAVFSPEKLLASLLSSQQPPLSRVQAIAHLDSVQLFPVFDFAAAVQAINEVSDILQKTWGARQPQKDHDHDAELGNEDRHNDESDANRSTTLIVAGLDTLTEAVIRASNAVRGTAVLISALRTLTLLSRMHRSYLSIVLVNTSGVGPVVHDDGGGGGRPQQGYQVQDDGVQSMFSTSNTPIFPSLMMRTLDRGIDTHLLVSNRGRVLVVEVIKDRVGCGVGKWCAWNSKR
ncbi:hypothetical protein BJX63DRAFT_421433 [Aspergillus granulosus]|uniref:F-box domain-containing protein n=1 Tax=Aspergillus granulosus TaxID=176169 RepID=A0ABR4HCD4_9EURO